MRFSHYEEVTATEGKHVGGRSYTYRRNGVLETRTEFVVQTGKKGELRRVVPFFEVDANYRIGKKIAFLAAPVFIPDEKKE